MNQKAASARGGSKGLVQSNQVLIIGPANTGKTCLLASLAVADAQMQFSDGLKGKLLQQNVEMATLCENASRIILGGSIPIGATNEVSNYEFTYAVESPAKPGFFGRGAPQSTAARYCFIDSPGGVLMDAHRDYSAADNSEFLESYRDLVQRASRSTGLLICIDSDNESTSQHFFVKLPTLLNQIGNPLLPFQRVVIFLTKADKYFSRHGRRAQHVAETEDPRIRASQLLTEVGLGALNSRLPPGANIACGWGSAFGFVPGEGTANFDPYSQGLRTHHPALPAHYVANSWRPFRVLEPLIYLTSGHPGHLQMFPR